MVARELHSTMGPVKDFKPTLLRNAVLFTLLCVTLVLLGLVEYSCRVLPRVERKGGGINLDGIIGRREVHIHAARYGNESFVALCIVSDYLYIVTPPSINISRYSIMWKG